MTEDRLGCEIASGLEEFGAALIGKTCGFPSHGSWIFRIQRLRHPVCVDECGGRFPKVLLVKSRFPRAIRSGEDPKNRLIATIDQMRCPVGWRLNQDTAVTRRPSSIQARGFEPIGHGAVRPRTDVRRRRSR